METAAQGGGNPDIYGVAHWVRMERSRAGQAAEVARGQGISAPDSIERGRTLLANGADPEAMMNEFERTARLSSDDMAVARAYGERLAQEARRIEERAGTNSEEWRAAYERANAWERRSKRMQTEWSKTGQAQQGATDIDTGSYTGLQMAYEDATEGKKFTPSQAKAARKLASGVKAADADARRATRRVFEETAKVENQANATDEAVAERQRTAEQAGNLGKALAASDKTVADAEAGANRAVRGRRPKAEVDAAKQKLEMARLARKAAQTALDAASKRARQAAIKAAKAEAKMAGLSTAAKLWKAARVYIEAGRDDLNEIIDKLAVDTGMSRAKVIAELARLKKPRRLLDAAWRKQTLARNMHELAKRWLRNQQVPGWERAIRSIPRSMFALKVGFHGTVALGTHAPAVMFQPRFWASYFTNFGRMYKLVFSPSYYEMQVQDMLRRENYVTARRAGLVNDPFTGEDFNDPLVSQYIGAITGMGNRGYFVLKILRQDMFDQLWNKLPKTQKIPEVAAAIADGVNHATGVTRWTPRGASVALFAPRLEASRVAWLGVDPARAVRAFANWANASEGEKRFAINQVKEKAWVLATLGGMLAMNQGLLVATGSKQRVNFTDPMAPDFMKFKAAGMTLSWGNPLITMARLPLRLWAVREGGRGKMAKLKTPEETTGGVLMEFGRSQLSPLASLLADVWTKTDWQGRPLPNSSRQVPKRLQAQGVQPYTWTEFALEQMAFIPAEEAIREVFKTGWGMDEEHVKGYMKALAIIAFDAATGGRLTDDPEAAGSGKRFSIGTGVK